MSTKLLAFGEVLWDNIEGRMAIGGALFNLAAHAAKLGIDEVYLFSAVGKDELGDRTLDCIRAAGVRTDFVRKVDLPTSIINVTLDSEGVPTYDIPADATWDHLTADQHDIDRINEIGFDFLCFGTLAQRKSLSHQNLLNLVNSCSFKRIFFDVNLRLDFYSRDLIRALLQASGIVKLNRDETTTVGEMFDIDSSDPADFAGQLMVMFEIATVIVTDGDKGAHILSGHDTASCQGFKVEVADTVGAGDAFSAATIAAITAGRSLHEVCEYACRVGALVASRPGAVPEYQISDL